MSTPDLASLRERIALTRLNERPRLDREWQRLRGQQQKGQRVDEFAAKLNERIDKSIAHIEQLRNAPLKLDYDPELPITAHREQVLKVLEQHQVVILCGATGSGKSTQ